MMKPAPLTLLATLLASSALTHADTEQRDLRDFTSIEVGGGIDIELRQDPTFAVEIDSGEIDLNDIITEVRRGTLKIRRDFDHRGAGFPGWWRAEDNVLVRISMPQLEELQASGGSDVETMGEFTGDELELHASGGSDLTFELAFDSVDIEASGGSDLRLSGKVRELIARTSGGSDMNAYDLEADEVDLHASGGSDGKVKVNQRLVATASGGSDISYRGEPQYRDVDTSGSSDVRHRR